MNERNYYLGFSLTDGIGPKTFKKLILHFKTAKNAWNSSFQDLKNAGLGEIQLNNFLDFRQKFSFSNYFRLLREKRVKFVALCDTDYPKLLAQIDSPPSVLFYRGNLKDVDFNKTIGIVGTRRVTNYGTEITQLFSTDLASSGLTVVSGLAMGVDAIAGWSAINANGKTIAVLGNGVDLCFPTTNKPLYDKILDGNGVIISQFPIGLPPSPGSFPSRNRIIAGLSLGVLVTEGAEDSGSLITANYAFEMKRPVFAIPGPITSSLSKAPLKLIEKGARLVLSAEDITKELRIKNYESRKNKTILTGLSSEEEKIVQILENESLQFDEIVRKLGVDSSKAGIILSMMEIKGILKSSDGSYSIVQ